MKLLPILLLLLLPFATQAQLTYTTNSGSITITGYTGNPTAVTIPAAINGYPVTGIGDYAFQNKSSLTNVTLPNSVITIGNYAFASCYKLTNAILGSAVTSIGDYAFNACSPLKLAAWPNTLTTIGSWAFADCYGLTALVFPDSVVSIGADAFISCDHVTNIVIGSGTTNIGINAFYGCPAVRTLTVAAANPAFSSSSGVLFDKSQSTLLFCPQTKSGNYVMPNSVMSIGNAALVGSGLASITLSESITNIGSYAFFLCGMTNVVLGKNVVSIGDGAFKYCQALSQIIIPKSVTSLGDSSFYNCIQLTNVFFLGNAPTNVVGNTFIYDYNTTVYYLPNTTGWGATLGGRPAVLWNPQAQAMDASFGVQTNPFGFNITGTSNLIIMVEACTNLAGPVWQSLQTTTLTNGSADFSDPQWTNYPSRFYRLRSP